MKENDKELENKIRRLSMMSIMLNPQNSANLYSPILFKGLYDELNGENEDGDKRKE